MRDGSCVVSGTTLFRNTRSPSTHQLRPPEIVYSEEGSLLILYSVKYFPPLRLN